MATKIDKSPDNYIDNRLNRGQARFQNTFSGTDINVVAYYSLQEYKLQNAFKQRSTAVSNKADLLRAEEKLRLLQVLIDDYESPRAFHNKSIREPAIVAARELVAIKGEKPLTLEESQQIRADIEAQKALISAFGLNNIGRKFNTQPDFEDSVLFDLGTITTLSYSMFREKFAVRNLGLTQAKAYTRGPRTIAGSMIFTVFNHFELDQMMHALNNIFSETLSINLLDQLPPFNVMLIFSNEYGQTSIMHLFDLQFNSEGQTQSIHDSMIDRTLNWYCEDMIPLRPVSKLFNNYKEMFINELPTIQDRKRNQIDTPIGGFPGKDFLTFEDLIGNTQGPGSAHIKELLARGRSTSL